MMFLQVKLRLKKSKFKILSFSNDTEARMQDGVISLFVLFFQFRPRDILRGLICLLYNYACIYMWVHVPKTTLKETVLWGTITWSEMGKQNMQAKTV